jgi:uncharacterized protein YndB with AHSA1/START domain
MLAAWHWHCLTCNSQLSRVEALSVVRKLLLAVVLVVLGAALLLAPLPVEDLTRIYTVVEIRRPPQAVFDYVTTPAHWPQWHPASRAVSAGADHPLQVGELTLEDFEVAGRRGQALWTVTEREAPRRWRIEATVEEHRAGSVTYTLSPSAEGTRFERELIYPSRNLLFAIVNRLSIRRQVEVESAQALAQLKERLETAS